MLPKQKILKEDIKRVLVPVDFSQASKNALKYLAAIFDNNEVHATILNIVPSNGNGADCTITELLDLQKTELDLTKIHVTCQVVYGDPVSEIIAAAEKTQTDLIILGVKGHGIELGVSITQSLLGALSCSVITVPERYTSFKAKTLAYASDYKAVQKTSDVDLLRQLALNHHSKIYLFHVFPEGAKDTNDSAEGALDYYLESTDHDYFSATSDDIFSSTRDFINEKNVDLISLLTRDHGQNKTASKGELIYKLIETAEIPVLIIN